MFCQEEYVLVSGDKRDFENLNPKSLLKTRFLAYPGVDVLFGYWLAHHFPKTRDITWNALNVVGEINNLHGVLEMVVSTMGVTIIPKHCVDDLFQSKKLFEYPGNGKPLLNDIYIATLAGRAIPRRVQTLVDVFFEMKN
jgi:DNA-binding transcriptional LysR family regulator